MRYVSTTERQVIKLSLKDISTSNLSIMIKAEEQSYKGILLYLKY